MPVLPGRKSGLLFKLPDKVFRAVVAAEQGDFANCLTAAPQQILRILRAASYYVLY